MNRITEMLGIKYPIIQGAMQDVAKARLVAAVSNAGGLGVLASGQDTPEQVREEIHKVKELTDKPFAVNLMFLNKKVPEIVDVVIEEGVKIVTTGAGTPKLYMPKLKEAGIKVMPVIPNVKIAKKMEELGVDAVIAEGMESGGHIGTMTSQTLWPQVVDAVKIPVIAAGGIADNRGVKAAMAMGAEGVQCGTIFSISKESPVGGNWKKVIIESKDTSIGVIGTKMGVASRTVVNKKAKELYGLEDKMTDKLKFNQLLDEAYRKAVYQDDVEDGIIFAGSVAGMIHESKSAAEIISDLMR
ncbi:enoyl-[acyl-carrier-protein] reductase FabK [Ligilactobacillus salivarius]|uniref:Probable nitronate monooxygenase n=2 Tax=Ligilactobacillus salivarius TaxID=1624 RepID=C2EJ91_9LACO|nr:nitronate monooxygenase [Ligilactobacillus salivarius]ATP38364.1 enoyl-[acyl-carrier-protein] reductase FabK [Ligilactobacillus salivarius]EEJ73357.1 putative enoyl-[acyl-carrier-protein] reductase II [Ligilactobacillus salivarius DSM 20555 = ATCC 11741]KRM68922.1 enoyl-[acyl-carrier-protein] reductase (NADH) [Ligilactobacillus salivarius DSM 20555 = ATCC 11741]MBE7938348.1 nitronate monooxygenase [Ligilactobacillus salivarius]MDG9756471.1 nitronate monooxygenase [Ligilactobacillus salivari